MSVLRPFSSSGRRRQDSSNKNNTDPAKLTHVSETGSAHMVSISDKAPTKRVATAVCRVLFTDATAVRLIRENQVQKGDVLGVARVAGIMAAKRTPDLIPLCHPIAITKVAVEFSVGDGGAGPDGSGGSSAGGPSAIGIEATVACDGKTGVEMEALTAACTAALTIYDMCKAVDKGMSIEGLRVVLKEGGKSGRWVDGVRELPTS
ncbi:hypothetical protein SLS62_008219 [Diatrype stigma]|uniref:cyclic pyranopterin monophosphate synthase n=1 Tax=Diatrype stigma TaxID=117547 RepID=A0AAN9UM19_9PEZI